MLFTVLANLHYPLYCLQLVLSYLVRYIPHSGLIELFVGSNQCSTIGASKAMVLTILSV